MLNFKEWFIINETKEEKALASELAGDAFNALSTVIPQKDKDTLLLLAAYYYSQTKDLEQVKTDMKDYIGYLNRDKMKLISVDLVSKKPNPPWDDYLYWTQMIHMHQGEDAHKERSKFKPSQDDFQGQVPFMISQDGQIKVYEANSPQQCIILGKGQSFCISQPGNRNWQGYRDKENSTFYFVYDDTRPADDRLGIVVVDVRENGIVLTDKPNNTGTTLDPYTGKLTHDSSSYMKYLREKGIDTSKFVNIPKSEEETAENRNLGRVNKDFNWFFYLSSDDKSKYIGRGNPLTDEQFDYLWENKFTSLLTQYAQTGLLLNDYQLDKIVSNRDLRDKYLHNRGIADQNSHDLTMKEYSLFSVKQKENYYDNLNDSNKLQKAIRFKDLDFYKYLVNEKGLKVPDNAVESATRTRDLDLVKFVIEKGAKIDEFADKEDAVLVNIAAAGSNLALVKYLVDEKKQPIPNNIVRVAILGGNLDIVRYFVDEKKKPILGNYAVENAARSGNVDIVRYLVDEKGKEISSNVLRSAIASGDLPVIKYLVDEKNLKVSGLDIDYAEKEGLYNIYDYLKSVRDRK